MGNQTASITLEVVSGGSCDKKLIDTGHNSIIF